MAGHLRHAAGRPLYEVHEVLGGEPALDLGVRFETVDLGAAVDFAFDFLDRQDPQREGAVSGLQIVRVEGSRREAVWSYDSTRAQEPSGNPVGVWGFDVTRRWEGPYRTPVRPKTAYR